MARSHCLQRIFLRLSFLEAEISRRKDFVKKKSCSNIASNSIDILLETARSLHRIQLLYGDILEVQKSSNLVNWLKRQHGCTVSVETKWWFLVLICFKYLGSNMLCVIAHLIHKTLAKKKSANNWNCTRTRSKTIRIHLEVDCVNIYIYIYITLICFHLILTNTKCDLFYNYCQSTPL